MSNIVKSDFPAMLEKFKPEIARALPSHLKADRMARIALTAFRRQPKLANCDPRSIFAAVIQSAQLGLEPDTLGRSYLIPYGSECQFVPGWKGLVDLVNRSGNATVWTGAVFEGDEFDYALGDRPFIAHKPGDEDDPSLITHVYAVGRVKGAEWPVIEVWRMSKVWRHRDRYNKVGKKHYSYGNEEMYARKVALLQVLKYMPASPELSQAIAMNDSAEIGRQGLTIDAAVNGTWVPVADDVDDPETPMAPQAKPRPETPAPTEPTKSSAISAPGNQATQAPDPQQTAPPGPSTISGLSEAQERILIGRAKSAGYDHAALLHKFGSIDLSNLNDVLAKLKAEIDAQS